MGRAYGSGQCAIAEMITAGVYCKVVERTVGDSDRYFIINAYSCIPLSMVPLDRYNMLLGTYSYQPAIKTGIFVTE